MDTVLYKFVRFQAMYSISKYISFNSEECYLPSNILHFMIAHNSIISPGSPHFPKHEISSYWFSNIW